MHKQTGSPCEELLQQWSAKRELANYYITALLRLSPDAPDALRRKQELYEYLRILEQQKRLNQVNYLHTLNMLKQPSLEVQSHITNDLNLNSAWHTCLPSMASSATSCVVCSTSVKTESKCSVVARYC
ncbi:MAG: hypothetical protein E6I79_02480 [Chloroflexi bacterium]|nr:MAG: hypothetical protein E6I79_02480 [Chloroflexota bacterium]